MATHRFRIVTYAFRIATYAFRMATQRFRTVTYTFKCERKAKKATQPERPQGVWQSNYVDYVPMWFNKY